MLKLKLQYFVYLMWRTDSFEKTLMLEKIEGEREGDDRGWDGITDLMGHESEEAPGVGDGQGGLVYWSSWGRKESDTTDWFELNTFPWNMLNPKTPKYIYCLG